MAFGSEAVLPTELEYGSPRVKAYNEVQSEQARQDTVYQLDEAQDIALLRLAKYRQTLHRYHGCRVQPCAFHIGDLVLQRS